MSKKINWSGEQLDAIQYRSGAAIVSAAAGSGKTAVLVERVKRLMLDPQDPVNADEMVITTFTKKAAAEMKTRLADALTEALGETSDPTEKKRIADQQLRLRDAYISTTDSLCMNILRRYSAEAGLRPDFRVLDDSRTKLLREQAMRTVMDSFCEASDDETAARRQLLYDRFAGEDDSQIEKAVKYLHTFSKKLPDADIYFEAQLAAYRDPAKLGGLIRQRYEADIAAAVREPLGRIAALAAELVPLTRELPPPILNKDGSVSSRSLTENPTAPAGDAWEKIAAAYALVKPDSPDVRERLAEANELYLKAKSDKLLEIKTSSKQIRTDDIKALSAELKDCCRALTEDAPALFELGSEANDCLPVLEALVGLMYDFDAEFSRLKAEEGGLDFDDMELKTLKLLREPDGSQSAVAKEIAAGVRIIIVDEFQDSNEVQYEIYRLISRDKTNLYLVGDIKQSIYRFRGADPLVFSRLTQEGSGFKVLPLNKNFRSCKQVIESVNAIFDGTMTVQCGDVDYNDQCSLVQGKVYATDDDMNRTEFIEFTGDDAKDSRTREAAYVAYRIKKMIAEGFPVSDGKEGARPCGYGDFAIIMGSYSNFAAIYKNALEEADIPYEAKDDSEYTDLEEVKYMLALLRVIDDPYRDADLAAVLMREPFLLSADELAQIKLSDRTSLRRGLEILSGMRSDTAAAADKVKQLYGGSLPDSDEELKKALTEQCGMSAGELDNIRKYGREKRQDLWSGLKAYAKTSPRAAAILSELEGYREFAAENSPARLIRKICDESMILPAFEAGRGGAKKGLNLRMLAHYAEDLPGGESAGLYDFLQYLGALEKKKIKLTKAEGDGSSRNVVRMMTIHLSKGLEFPICFIVNLQTDSSITPELSGLVCDARYGIGMTSVDTVNRLKINTYTYKNVLEEYKRLERSERMRLLYVAVTRAREKLIITVPQPPKNPNETHWGWISLSKAVENGLIVPEFDPQFTPPEGDAEPEDAPPVTVDISEGYEYADYAAVPAKFTATQIGVNNEFEHEGRSDDATRALGKPSFLKSSDDGRLTGKKLGDAYHKALERLDFAVPPDSVTAELDRICERGGLTAAERRSIDDEDIRAFLESGLCRRALACGRENIFKEHPLFYQPQGDELLEICRRYGVNISRWEYDDRPVIQGITDLFFIEDGGIVLADYKTNTHVTAKDLTDEYRGQLAIYAHALSESMGMPVKEKLLYSFWLEREGRKEGAAGRGVVVIPQ